MADTIPISLTNALHNVLPILGMVNSLTSSERTLHQIIERMVSDFNCTTCAILIIDPVSEHLTIRSFHGLSWNYCKNYNRAINTPIIKELIWKGEPVSVHDSEFNPVVSDELRMEKEFASCYAVPLTANQKPMGYLFLDSDSPDNFTSERQLLAQVYAHLIGITLFREELSEALKRMDSKDAVSGAVKYTHFFPRLQEVFQQAERLHDPFSILLLDIEGYGGFLKTYGLESTRIMLNQLVQNINKNLRTYDGLSRFGTDEFLITLPGTRLHESVKAGEKLRNVLKEAKFTDQKLSINFFIAVANYPENCSTLDGLLTAVRNALLEAKRSNRINEVVSLKQIVG